MTTLKDMYSQAVHASRHADFNGISLANDSWQWASHEHLSFSNSRCSWLCVILRFADCGLPYVNLVISNALHVEKGAVPNRRLIPLNPWFWPLRTVLFNSCSSIFRSCHFHEIHGEGQPLKLRCMDIVH